MRRHTQVWARRRQVGLHVECVCDTGVQVYRCAAWLCIGVFGIPAWGSDQSHCCPMPTPGGFICEVPIATVYRHMLYCMQLLQGLVVG